MAESLAYYIGLPYTIITEEEGGIFNSYVKEFGKNVNGISSTKEESIKECLYSKQEYISALLKHGINIPLPEKEIIKTQNIEPIIVNSPNETELLNVLNNLLKIKNIKYLDFNSNIPFNKKIKELRELERSNNKLHLSNSETENEGISTLSIIATITEILTGKILAFIVEGDESNKDDWVITGVKFLDENK